MAELTAIAGSQSVFINGGSTPLGRALARLLVAAGHKVMATVTGSAEASAVRAEGVLPAYPSLTRMGELRSAIMAAKANIVVNLAPTYPHQAPQAVKDWDAYTTVVEEGTRALLEAAAAAGVEYVIQGSFSLLGGDPHHQDEDHEPPVSSFVNAARKAEAAVKNAHIPYTLLRFGFVYSSESSALQTLREALLRGRSFLPGSSHTRANWIHADDGARAILLAIATRPIEETLNVVDDRPVTPSKFVELFAAEIGVQSPGQPPMLLVGLMAGETVRAMLEQPSGASNEATRARLGWTLRYPTLEAGLEQSLMMWRAQEPVRA
jgi:nucleoside-diphosphate-sugar epimerase